MTWTRRRLPEGPITSVGRLPPAPPRVPAVPERSGHLREFGDRGDRLNPDKGDYRLTGQASGNHSTSPAGQNVLMANNEFLTFCRDSESKCLVGYINGELGDNIYSDSLGEDDTFLLSSEVQVGSSASK